MGFLDVEGGSTISSATRKSSRHGSSKQHHSSSSHRRNRSEREIRGRQRSYEKRSRSRSLSGNRSINVSARSFFGLGDDDNDDNNDDEKAKRSHRANKSTTSFFSLPNMSSRSIFSSFGRAGAGGAGGSSSSYYRRSPRSSFMHRAYKKLKRLIRDLIYYAKKHPLKVFMLVIMPLITGGALTALLARFGLRLPRSLERLVGAGARAASGDSVGLVGEAMRMAAVAGTGAAAGAGGVSGAAKSMATSLERGRRGDMQWERRRVERKYFDDSASRSGRSETGSGWGSSLAGIKKFFS
ncbi:MAG: hypothetical protein STHCBS139747_001387 [Sporothrix thermara]